MCYCLLFISVFGNVKACEGSSIHVSQIENASFTEVVNEQGNAQFDEPTEFASFVDEFTELDDGNLEYDEGEASGSECDSASDQSTEDEDYIPSDNESENNEPEFVPGLEQEDQGLPHESEFLSIFDDVVNSTFDCTESIPQPTRPSGNGFVLCLGQEFPNIYKLRDHLRMYGIVNKVEIKFKKNNSDKVVVICRDPRCHWRCYARRLNDGFTFSIRGLQEEHTCSNSGTNRNKLASAAWVASVIEDEMRMHHTSFTPRDIVKLVWHKYGVTINYWLAWKARGKALERVHGN